MTVVDGPGWVLWSGTIGLESPIDVRISAAVVGGYARVSVSPLDVARSEAAGVSAVDLGERFRASGLDVVVDPIMNWYGGTPPPTSRFGRFSAEEALRMSRDLGAVSATVIGQGSDDVPVAAITEAFGGICDRAAEFGMQVHLEFTAIHSIRTLRTAWDIVSGADRQNGGLLFDTWHFFRTDPDFSLLEQIPGDRIFAVQVDDAHPDVMGTMRDDTLNRLMPGDGSFDLVRALATLDRIGGLAWVGPEVISPQTAAMDPVVAARTGRARIEDILMEARRS